MLEWKKSMRQICFRKLMEVYEEGNRENAGVFYSEESADRGLALAEEDFYQYLNEVFFQTPDAVYAVWTDQGQYVSALRLEPYQDGLLLEALETRPDMRERGYASALIRAVQQELAGDTKVYSHVWKRNIASCRTHECCGFRQVLDYSVGIDGSVNSGNVTYGWVHHQEGYHAENQKN